MIVYNLGCSNEHRFEGWFASADDYARQTQSKLLVCPMCGDERVSRLPHAPYVSTGSAERSAERAERTTGERAANAKAPGAAPKKGSPQYYANLGAEILQNVIEKVLENTEDVGRAVPEEARKIHYKEAPERHIRGTASTKEVEALRDEGIEVVALPVPPHRMGKTH